MKKFTNTSRWLPFFFSIHILAHSWRVRRKLFPSCSYYFPPCAHLCVIFCASRRTYKKITNMQRSNFIDFLSCLTRFLALAFLLGRDNKRSETERETMTMKFNEKALQGIFIKKKNKKKLLFFVILNFLGDKILMRHHSPPTLQYLYMILVLKMNW